MQNRHPLVLFVFTAAFCLGLSACGGSGPTGSGGGAGNSSTSSASSSSSSSTSSSSSSTSSSSSSSSGATSSTSSSGANVASGFASMNGGTTGGAGGAVEYATTGTEIHQALCDRAADDTPIIIQVEGTISPANTTQVSGSCNTAADVIEIKEVRNVTIVGVGSGAIFDEIGIHIRASSNIILQNLHIRDVKKSNGVISNGGDAIGMEADVSNVWVDHCTLEAFGGEAEGYDGLFDLKNNTQYVTLSYSILKNSGRGGLVGASDNDIENNYISYHHNLYANIDSRTPLLRFATAHSYNNHFNGINASGMNPRIGGSMKAENNYFENAKDPIGTFYTEDLGTWDVSGNFFASTVTWSDEGSENYPAGPNPASTTTIAIPYTYALDDARCIPQIIATTAGANTGMQTSDGSACQVAAAPVIRAK